MRVRPMRWQWPATMTSPPVTSRCARARWSVGCMSYLRFDAANERVAYEADFHDKGSRAKSLGIP